ncbi:hypothetical protein HELRODRAFT_124632, partial [Helobdella robusta]|uniref:HIT-type domain-containing protein n=1 Tax=Helobdella robusta TaxID=6412 RepID=T1EH21_HELRO
SACDFCLEAPPKYKCPKCFHNYCSTKCYQSEKHIKCSESFYRDCCLEGLKSKSKIDNPNKMKSILNRHKLENELELGNDEQESHIDEAFANLNLDVGSKRFWDELDYEEKLEFLHLQLTNSLSSLIDVWNPWWMEVLPEHIEDETVINALLEKLPKLHDISSMNDSTMGRSSHCIVFNLINIIYGYAYISKLFNGDWKDLLLDSVHGFICISSSLQDTVFTDVSTALQ